MIPWLDHKIFGNGFGLRSPYFDNRFHWLVDLNRDDRRGELYTFMHGFGAQLHSIQWRHPKAGEERRLSGYRFRPMHSSRRWFRVMVAWSWVDLPKGIDEANAALRQIAQELGQS